MPDTSPNSGNGGLRGLVMFPFTVVPAVRDGATEAPARLEEALAQLAEMRRTLEQLAADFANVPAHVDPLPR